METPEVARALERIADLLVVREVNPFRVRAYRTAAQTVRDLSVPLAEFVRAGGKRLGALQGLGADPTGKITTLMDTGELPQLRELREQVLTGLCEFRAPSAWRSSESRSNIPPKVGATEPLPDKAGIPPPESERARWPNSCN